MNIFTALVASLCMVLIYMSSQILWRYRRHLFVRPERHVLPTTAGITILLAMSWHRFYIGLNSFEHWSGWINLAAYALLVYGYWLWLPPRDSDGSK